LEFFGAMHGLDRRAARSRASEVLSAMQLEDVGDRRFDGYSSGMRTRLSIGRALLAEPPVLLLDEPSRTLDPVVASQLREMICALAKRQSLAVLWVTHDLHEACEIADRVALVVAGRVTAEQLHPQNSSELSELFRSSTLDDLEGPGG